MKRRLLLLQLIALCTFGIVSALGHGQAETGPNGGRILEFSKDESVHGELTVKDGKFHIALLDKAMKPIAIKEQTLTITTGDRDKPEKLAVQKEGDQFVAPAVQAGQWAIFQFRQTAKAKPVTARVEYDTKECGECKKPEWLCSCGREQVGK